MYVLYGHHGVIATCDTYRIYSMSECQRTSLEMGGRGVVLREEKIIIIKILRRADDRIVFNYYVICIYIYIGTSWISGAVREIHAKSLLHARRSPFVFPLLNGYLTVIYTLVFITRI